MNTVASEDASGPLLRVEDLRVGFATAGGVVRAVDGVSFELRAGRTLGIVGESGSGKTVSALALMGLLPRHGASVRGRAELGGVDLLTLPERRMRALRGAELAMVFQDSLSSLHPLLRVGAQITEALRAHRALSRSAARARAVALLEQVGIPQAGRRVDAYPHELSGGMRQRAMIAMALANEPRLLIADEPTTALDVTVQAQILALLRRLRDELGMALLLVTHDLGVVAEMADEVAVMRAGRILERGPADRLLTPGGASDPYTQSLVRALPTLSGPRGETTPRSAPAGEPLLEVRGLVKSFALTRRVTFARRAAGLEAVAGIDLELRSGETLGLVGESGCGKSTTARLLTRLLEPTAGQILFEGRDLAHLQGAALRSARREMQLVFQDPYSSLNPRRPVDALVGEPFAIHGLHRDRGERRRVVAELLERVGLRPELHARYPHELSGGQRQRVGIARALALAPKLLIADEPVSALDLTVQAQILELLRRLQRELGLALLLISHDLAVVRGIADRVAVMRAGRIVELAPTETLYEAPRHPYTRELLAAVPGAHRRGVRSPG